MQVTHLDLLTKYILKTYNVYVQNFYEDLKMQMALTI